MGGSKELEFQIIHTALYIYPMLYIANLLHVWVDQRIFFSAAQKIPLINPHKYNQIYLIRKSLTHHPLSQFAEMAFWKGSMQCFKGTPMKKIHHAKLVLLGKLHSLMHDPSSL